MHKLISANPWVVGKEKMEKQDILALCAEMQRIRDLHGKLRRAIMNSIARTRGQMTDVPVGIEMDVTAPWRRRMRKVKNNLGLGLVYIGSG